MSWVIKLRLKNAFSFFLFLRLIISPRRKFLRVFLGKQPALQKGICWEISHKNALRILYFWLCNWCFGTLGDLFSTGLLKQHFICQEKTFAEKSFSSEGYCFFRILPQLLGKTLIENVHLFCQHCNLRVQMNNSREKCLMKFIKLSISLDFYGKKITSGEFLLPRFWKQPSVCAEECFG